MHRNNYNATLLNVAYIFSLNFVDLRCYLNTYCLTNVCSSTGHFNVLKKQMDFFAELF